MLRTDFNYQLPEHLIAQHPLEQRTASRLLVLDTETAQLADQQFTDLIELLNPDDLLIFNNTRVVHARLFGHKESGGKIEILLERVLDDQHALAQVRASKAPKPGSRLLIGDDVVLTMTGRQGDLFELELPESESFYRVMEALGHVPLPPYIQRPDKTEDLERYQTVYSERPGAVAAPTAGLHFDQASLQALADKGVESGFVTLHVGAGTYQPVRVDRIEDHHMHCEYIEVGEQVCAQIAATKARGGRVVAVGTTSVRCLETASASGECKPYFGDTDIFIYPGYEFRSVDAMLTNFHLPESTLLMLVCAFAGQQLTLDAYRHAVEQQYRFFSYGDAMFINGTGLQR